MLYSCYKSALFLMEGSACSCSNDIKSMLKREVSYPVDLGVLQQELHYLGVASSGCKVQRGAELAVEQVWITVSFLQ